MDWITMCACGAELPEPCDPRDFEGGAGFRAWCDRCNDRFNQAMAAEFPYGQCRGCGAAYHPVTVECGPCLGLGEQLVYPHDPANPQWMNCPACQGTGRKAELYAHHEETICGFPHGDGYADQFETPTFVDVLRWARERAEYIASLPPIDLRSVELAW